MGVCHINLKRWGRLKDLPKECRELTNMEGVKLDISIILRFKMGIVNSFTQAKLKAPPRRPTLPYRFLILILNLII